MDLFMYEFMYLNMYLFMYVCVCNQCVIGVLDYGCMCAFTYCMELCNVIIYRCMYLLTDFLKK